MRLHFVKRPRLGIVLRPRKVALYSVGSEVSPFYLHGRRYAAPTYLSCFSFRLMTVSNVFGVVAVISICSFFFFECGRFFAFSSFARSDIPTRLLCSVWYFRRFILLLRVFLSRRSLRFFSSSISSRWFPSLAACASAVIFCDSSSSSGVLAAGFIDRPSAWSFAAERGPTFEGARGETSFSVCFYSVSEV